MNKQARDCTPRPNPWNGLGARQPVANIQAELGARIGKIGADDGMAAVDVHGELQHITEQPRAWHISDV